MHSHSKTSCSKCIDCLSSGGPRGLPRNNLLRDQSHFMAKPIIVKEKHDLGSTRCAGPQWAWARHQSTSASGGRLAALPCAWRVKEIHMGGELVSSFSWGSQPVSPTLHHHPCWDCPTPLGTTHVQYQSILVYAAQYYQCPKQQYPTLFNTSHSWTRSHAVC